MSGCEGPTQKSCTSASKDVEKCRLWMLTYMFGFGGASYLGTFFNDYSFKYVPNECKSRFFCTHAMMSLDS